MGDSEFRPDRDDVGTIGVVCGATTLERVVRKTPRGPLHQATCTRWAGHGGLHNMTRGRDFARLFEWGPEQTAAPDWKAARRREMAVAARESRG